MSNQKPPEIYLMLLPNDRVSGVLEEWLARNPQTEVVHQRAKVGSLFDVVKMGMYHPRCSRELQEAESSERSLQINPDSFQPFPNWKEFATNKTNYKQWKYKKQLS